MALTLDKLFDAYTDSNKDFAEYIYEWFGVEGDTIAAKEFAETYSKYLPSYDPIEEDYAFADKYLDFRNASAVQRIAEESTEEVYSQELEKASGKLKTELATGKKVAGGLGLRSGSLERALEDTIVNYSNKAEDLGDRLRVQKEEDINTYNTKITESTLDYNKDISDTKQDFYDRVMSSIDRLVNLGAFNPREEYVAEQCTHCWTDYSWSLTALETCLKACQQGLYTGG